MSFKPNEFTRANLLLTGYYVAGVLVLLIISSVTIYLIFTSGIVLNGNLINGAEIDHREFSLSELKENLINIIILVNFIILSLFAISAYFFAKQTLKPIKTMYQKQERFISDVAHELRTPLTVLESGAENILRKQRTNVEYIDFIKESKEETERLTRLSNELLFLLSPHKNTPTEFRVINLTTVIKNQLKQHRAYAQEKKITLIEKLPEQIFLAVIPDSFIRLLSNLLKNAIDYNRPNGTVTISLAKFPNEIILTVVDTGIGMSTEDTKRVFERFYKTDISRLQNSHTGTGLGLPIVKEIVNAHNGTIALTSKINVGTTINIHLPNPTTDPS